MTSLSDKMVTDLMYAMETRSSDRQTQVGCVITDNHNNVLVTGANALTDGMIEEMTTEMYERPEKYDWIEHAERSAIFDAAKRGIKLEGAVMYLTGFPCVECARGIAQSGIKILFHGSTEGWDEERYKFNKSRKIMETAGVSLYERTES
jgi:dCMP deaminase